MRPQFKDIKSYDEFKKHYWYLEELKQICKDLKIDYSGGKIELNHNIEEYFKGNLVKKKQVIKKSKSVVDVLTLDTKLVECGFVFNQKFRDFFIKQTGIENFKFNADMVATAKKVKLDNDDTFTLGDMLDIYYGKKEYAKYDNSSCQWNKFLRDFCADGKTDVFNNKLKAASKLWSIVRDSPMDKVYSRQLLDENWDILNKYFNC